MACERRGASCGDECRERRCGRNCSQAPPSSAWQSCAASCALVDPWRRLRHRERRDGRRILPSRALQRHFASRHRVEHRYHSVDLDVECPFKEPRSGEAVNEVSRHVERTVCRSLTVHPTNRVVSPEHGKRVVAEPPLRRGHVGLESILPFPEMLETLSIPNDRIERGKEPNLSGLLCTADAESGPKVVSFSPMFHWTDSLVGSVVVGVAPSAGATPSWSIVPSPSPSPAPSLGNTLYAVSCVTATDCFAVGATDTYIHGAGAKTLVERSDGTSWSVVASPNSATALGSELNGVSCVSATECVAVGDTYTNPNPPYGGTQTETLVEQWDGISWSIVANPNPLITKGGASLQAVSCSTATSCFAVGSYATPPIKGYIVGHTLVERWDGTSWSIVPSPNGASRQRQYVPSDLSSVSCPTVQFCVAVGPASNSYAHGVAFVQRWNGTRWLNDPTAVPADLWAVSCPTATSCLAVGTTAPVGGSGSAERWDGTRWSTVPTRRPDMYNLSCASATNCIAVGASQTYGYPGEQSQTAVEQWDGTAWTVTATPNPHPTWLRAVSCPSTTYCVAVGWWAYKGGDTGRAIHVDNRPAADCRDSRDTVRSRFLVGRVRRQRLHCRRRTLLRSDRPARFEQPDCRDRRDTVRSRILAGRVRRRGLQFW